MRVLGPTKVNGATSSAPGIGAAFPVLLALEDWKHVGEGSPLGSVVRPPVVISLHSPTPDHGVNAGAAAKYMAEGHIEFAIA